MAFTTNGSSHKNGIKNEARVAKKLQQLGQKLFPSLSGSFQVTLSGGTQNKADIIVEDVSHKIPVSVKRKESLGKGSYDYVNSSAAVKQIASLAPICDQVKQIVNSHNPNQLTVWSKSAVNHVRSACNDVFEAAMKKMTSSELSKILKDHINEKNDGFTVVVSDISTQKDYKFNYNDMPLKNSIDNHTPKLVWGRGKTSCKVVFEDSSGTIHDHGIRMRVVLNNGVNALLGNSNSNKTSMPVVKIQQDRVDNVISAMQKINKVQTF